MKDSPTKTICFFNSNKSFGEAEEKMLAMAKESQRQGDTVILVTNVHSQLAARAVQEKLNVYRFRMGPLSFVNPMKIFIYTLFIKLKKINSIYICNERDRACLEYPAKFNNCLINHFKSN